MSRIAKGLGLMAVTIIFYGCVPELVPRKADAEMPARYLGKSDSTNSAIVLWRDYFHDPHLQALIDTALKNNQELNIFSQEIEISRNEVMARKGEYLPFVGLGAAAGVEKAGRYTRNGAVEENLKIREGEEFPDPLPDFMVGAYASWELDIWRKLRNAKKAALSRYVASEEGRRFMITNLIGEIASSYYELLALDNQLVIVRQNIQIQSDALNVVRLQKESARVTELAVRRFEAQVLDTRSLQFDIQQLIVETENRINFLTGRFPGEPVPRDPEAFNRFLPDSISAGVPAQLLENRPDIRQAELELLAADLDIRSAKANFYPSIGIRAGMGYQAFNPQFLLSTPESLIYSMAGELAAPLVNRMAIRATYNTANAKQIQAVYDYEQTILRAYIEVVNELSRIENLRGSYDLRQQQVAALTESVDISNNLFRSARADYMEVLLTQRDALESRFDLIDTKLAQMQAWVSLYRAMGGGWR